MKKLLYFVGVLYLLITHQYVYAANNPNIPEPLKPWVDWVLYEQDEQFNCIPHYNDSNQLQCNWPTELVFDLHDTGGQFSQTWMIRHESWVILPGNNQQWPQEIKVNGKPIVVVQKDRRPVIQLQPGSYLLEGTFSWPKLPEYLLVPPQSALVSLTVNNERIEFPNLDNFDKLWLKSDQKEEKIENRLKVESFRLIEDRIPARIEIYIALDVAGSAREITLGPLYSTDSFIPIILQSSLPAKLEEDAKLKVQVRPGRYHISLITRYVGPLQNLTFEQPKDGFWPNQEIWSLRSHTDLRIIEIEGVPAIDPKQTSMPRVWQKYPAYRVLSGEAMFFKEIKRGDPQPAPDQLTMDRNLWLRFDGSGYTLQDRITGKKNTNWRLEMAPSLLLGRISIGGKEQFITKQKDTDRTGIELREGVLDLTADSNYQGDISTLPATGWQHDFQKVSGRLHLPPGWNLINASGIDNIPYTWVKRWTLLDFFIVLIFTIAMANLFSKPLAVIAFITLVLTYHEPDAPKYIWLALLIGYALLKHLPEGSVKKGVRAYQLGAVFILIILVIPYSIQALRIGIYPQLARPWTSMTDYANNSQQNERRPAPRAMRTPATPQVVDDSRVERSRKEMPGQSADILFFEDQGQVIQKAGGMVVDPAKKIARKALAPMESYSSSRPYRSQVMQYDPKSLAQTGPGIPQWAPFETIEFSWSGPVTTDQTISFMLIGPRTNLVLAFVRVFLIIILAFGMLGFAYRRGTGFQYPDVKSIFSSFASILLLLILFSPGNIQAGEIPSQDMLNELQKRLLEKDECFPLCANVSDINITISPEKLIIVANIDAQIDTAIPLPSHTQHWLPQQVIVDDSNAQGLFKFNNNLWVMMPAGKHTLKLDGLIRKQNSLQLPFPLKPHHIEMNVSGWTVDGIYPDGSFDSQLHFKRIVEQQNKVKEILETGVLPAFTLLERNILLDLVWKVETTIRRISPTGSAIVLNIPLLPGESVITDGIRVKDGIAQVNLGSNQTVIKWESFLEPSDSILMSHAKTDEWTEVWRVDISPIYHLETEGIPVIHHKSGTRWYPTWHPWPGEEVTLKITRPAGVDGRTITIERSHLELRPGRRSTDGKLSLTIKSSQGGQHTIKLPPDVQLQEVKIGGKVQSIRQEGRNVPLPITPGQQRIDLQWRGSTGITSVYKTPDVDLGVESVNSSVDLHLPRSRWPLFVGGEQLVGPAILFYSVLFIIILVSIGLSLTKLTPLKFYHWLLLGIGMSMSNLGACLLVVGWLIALDLRTKVKNNEVNSFNMIQTGIVFLTVLALGSLVFAISQGLLGHPDMNIVGNGSNGSVLRWYQDVSDKTLPQSWMVSAPMFAYRGAMLAWALWISFTLISIIKWGWKCFTEPTIWYHSPTRITKKKVEKNIEKKD